MRKGYIAGSGWVVLITLLYPICWACSEGGNVVSVTSEMVWYGVLDLLLGPFFLYYYIFSLRSVDYAAFGLQSWKYSDTAYGGPGYGGGAAAPAAGAGTGAAATPAVRAKEAEAGVAPATATGTATGAAEPVNQPVETGAV